MKPIPPKLRKQIDEDQFYKTCALYGQKDHMCDGRITYEHAVIFAGNRVQTLWAIVPICAKYHEVDEFQDSHNMDKEMHVWVALNRATDEDLKAMCGETFFKTEDLTPMHKTSRFLRERTRLNKLYGPYTHQIPADWSIYQKPVQNAPQKRFNGFYYKIQPAEERKMAYIEKFYRNVFNKTVDQQDIISEAIDSIYQSAVKYEKSHEKNNI